MQKALVVDDSRAIRGILARILASQGFEVCEARNGAEALAAVTGEAADLTLLCADYNMPVMGGVELMRQMRAMPRFAHLPFLMITTETHLHSMESALEAGANEYVMKPFTAEIIVDKLRVLGLVSD